MGLSKVLRAEGNQRIPTLELGAYCRDNMIVTKSQLGCSQNYRPLLVTDYIMAPNM